MTKKLLFLLCALTSSSAIEAQKVIKKGLFEASVLGYCRGTSSSTIANVEVDAQNAQLNVYTYSRIPGTFDLTVNNPSGEKPKSVKGKLGAFAKMVETTNKANDAANKLDPAASCISIRKMPFEFLMTKIPDVLPNDDGIKEFMKDPYVGCPKNQMEVALAYPNLFKPNTTYKFSRGKCESGYIDFGTLPLLSYDQLIAKYPLVDYGKESEKGSKMTYEGDGFLGTKNVRAFPVNIESHRYIDSLTANIFYSAERETPVKKEEAIAKLKGYYNKLNVKALTTDDGKVNFAIINQESSKEDKYGDNKNFKVVTYNNEGSITNMVDVKTEFVKEVKFFNFVLDKKGNKTGVLLILSSYMMIGGKSHKDPVENNHILYYFDLEGKEKYHYNFTHGDPDNPRGVFPKIVVEDKGALRMLNGNYEKILKPYTEVINFDEKGKGTFVNLAGDNNSVKYVDGFGSNQSKMQVLEDGNFLIFDQKREKKTRQNGAFEESYYVYTSASFLILTPDLDLVNSGSYDNTNASIPAKLDYLGKYDNEYKMIITTQLSNHFLSIASSTEKKGSRFTCPDGSKDYELIQLPPNPVKYNYYVDKETRKIYAIYEHKRWTMLGYVVVMSY